MTESKRRVKKEQWIKKPLRLQEMALPNLFGVVSLTTFSL